MYIGNKEFVIGKKPYIMGILNVTPDSFSDGGTHNKMEDALKTTEQMIKDGADIIDVGGESTRPGYTLLPDDVEIERVVPVIEAIKKRFDVSISLDTYKSGVAREGIKAGADLINDIWGLRWDGHMAQVVAEGNVSCCLMHNRKDTNYVNFLQDLCNDIQISLDLAKAAGVKMDKIMLDPGIGFAKSLEQNRLVMNNLELLKKWELPILLGTSRKSMIGLTLDLPVNEREEGTIATSVIGLMKGVDFFRVHSVKENYRALKMTDAILKER